jgi:hypothetical protein
MPPLSAYSGLRENAALNLENRWTVVKAGAVAHDAKTIASFRLEGLEPLPGYIAQLESYIRGELTLARTAPTDRRRLIRRARCAG